MWKFKSIADRAEMHSGSVVESGPDQGLTLSQLIDLHGARMLGERVFMKYDSDRPQLADLISEGHSLSVDVAAGQEPSGQADAAGGKPANLPLNLVKNQQFCVNLIRLDSDLMRDYSESDSFVILHCTDGHAHISCGGHCISVSPGHSLLVPAIAQGIRIEPAERASLIETYIF